MDTEVGRDDSGRVGGVLNELLGCGGGPGAGPGAGFLAGLAPTAEDEACIFTPRESRVSASSEGYPSGERPGEMTPAESERMLGGLTPAAAAERAAEHLLQAKPRPTEPDMLEWNANRQRYCWRRMYLPSRWDSMVASAGGPGRQR